MTATENETMGLQAGCASTQQAIADQLARLSAQMDKFNLFFCSANGVPPNARVPVPTPEWQQVYASFVNLTALMEQQKARTVEPSEQVKALAKTRGTARTRMEPSVFPWEALGRLVDEAISAAASNGANSVSMPDDYVALAYLLSFPRRVRAHDGAAGAPSAYHGLLKTLHEKHWRQALEGGAEMESFDRILVELVEIEAMRQTATEKGGPLFAFKAGFPLSAGQQHYVLGLFHRMSEKLPDGRYALSAEQAQFIGAQLFPDISGRLSQEDDKYLAHSFRSIQEMWDLLRDRGLSQGIVTDADMRRFNRAMADIGKRLLHGGPAEEPAEEQLWNAVPADRWLTTK